MEDMDRWKRLTEMAQQTGLGGAHAWMDQRSVLRTSYDTYQSAGGSSLCCSVLIRVRAAAASSRAQLTEDVSRRNTSGSASLLPSTVDSLPMPDNTRVYVRQWLITGHG